MPIGAGAGPDEDAGGILQTADAGTPSRRPMPGPGRAAEPHPEVGPRPRAKAARAAAPDRRALDPTRSGPVRAAATPHATAKATPADPPRAAPPHPPRDGGQGPQEAQGARPGSGRLRTRLAATDIRASTFKKFLDSDLRLAVNYSKRLNVENGSTEHLRVFAAPEGWNGKAGFQKTPGCGKTRSRRDTDPQLLGTDCESPK